MTVLRGRLRGKRIIVLGVLGAVLALAGIAEAVLRYSTADRMADRMSRRLDADLTVSLGGTPVLVQLARGSFPHVEVEGSDATFRNFTGVSFDADLADVVREDGALRVGSSQVRAELSAEAIAASVASRGAGDGDGDAPNGGLLGGGSGGDGGRPGLVVTTDPASGQLVAHAGPGQLVTVAMRPRIDGEALALDRTGVSVGDRPVPDRVADRWLADLPRSLDLSELPLELRPDTLTVTDDGLRMDLKGERATVRR
ncbi:LmeA family phospholipid-binding protein [Streptomyces youssoufiensis]